MVEPVLGEKTTAVTGFSWPRRSKTGRASRRSKIFMLPSRDEEARKLPLGWKDTWNFMTPFDNLGSSQFCIQYRNTFAVSGMAVEWMLPRQWTTILGEFQIEKGILK